MTTPHNATALPLSPFVVKAPKRALPLRLDPALRPGKARLDDEGAAIAPGGLYDIAAGVETLGGLLDPGQARPTFTIGIPDAAMAETFCLGWALAGHRYDALKTDKAPPPLQLVWPQLADRRRITALFAGIGLTRDLINTPPNLLGPVELEQAARAVAAAGKAKITVVAGDRLAREYPLVHAVGVSSPREPRLIDFTWGGTEPNQAPKLTLVGKGVCFDTGGLDLKPGPFMLQMKKDMGGAAHVLGPGQHHYGAEPAGALARHRPGGRKRRFGPVVPPARRLSKPQGAERRDQRYRRGGPPDPGRRTGAGLRGCARPADRPARR